MSNENKFGIYVELDALLDTRLATIAKMSDNAAYEILSSGKYHQREEDIFEGIDSDIYKELYLNRDGDTLAKSTMTGIIAILSNICNEINRNPNNEPIFSGTCVYLNTFPYVMENEVCEAIINALKIWIGVNTNFRILCLPPKQVTIDWCRDNIKLMVMYDYGLWMNTHINDFDRIRIPEVTIFAPAIYFNNRPTDKEMEELRQEAPHPFISLELLTKILFDLNLIDVRYFSIVSETELKILTEGSKDILKTILQTP